MTINLKVGLDGRVLVDKYHGIGRMLYEMLRELGSLSQVRITLFVPPVVSDRFPLSRLGPAIRTVPVAIPLPSALQTLRWPEVLRRNDIDVMVYPYHLGAPVVSSTPQLVIIHDCILETDRMHGPRFVGMPYRLATNLVANHSTVLTVSETSARALHEHYNIDVPTEHVIRPAAASNFQPGYGRSAGLTRHLPERYLLHVGAHRPHKNVETLLKALPLLPPEMKLVLVGSVDHRHAQSTTSIVEELELGGRVIHLESVSELLLPAIYEQAEALVYPSLIEGFGLPIMEAMAMGTPVVASDIPVFREVAGDAALFAHPDEPHHWVMQVMRIMNDRPLRDELVRRGHSVSAARSWRAAAATMIRAAAAMADHAPNARAAIRRIGA